MSKGLRTKLLIPTSLASGSRHTPFDQSAMPRKLRNYVFSVIRTGTDEAHASIQPIVRRHQSARVGVGTRAVATRARGFLWVGRTSVGRVDSALPGVLRRAVAAASYRCWRRARQAAAARQGGRIRPGND